ncbi:MAG: arginine--tRNA ligase [Clostridia bacterium]|nr:arginine--tRNA ligase [Clostridia bacterium]
MYTLQKKKAEVYSVVENAVKKAFGEVEMPAFAVEEPRDKAHGDYAVNAAMLLAKALKKNPREIATAIIENIDNSSLKAVKIEPAGPGFINFTLDKDYIKNVLFEIEEKGEGYGDVNVGEGKKVMIEFVSANPTGPMHMGNARGGALGDTLANVLKKAGWDVTKEFYINDAGAQIEKFGNSLEGRYIQILKGEDAIEFSPDWYQGDDIRVHAQNYIDLYGDGLLNVTSEERRAKLIDYALELNIDALKSTLSSYRIDYDVWFRESVLHEAGDVMETVNKLVESGMAYENEGAIWLKSTLFGSEKDDVLVRQNGIPTYFAADIAYHRNKIETRNFDLCINIWGADHHGHIARMKGALEAVGQNSEKLMVLIIQLVRLMSEGQPVRMSKRTGKMITLSDLIDEIGVDAARFFFNMRAAGSHMDFDLDLAVKQSNDNPVFYVQYAHARICSIVRLLTEEGTKVPSVKDIDLGVLNAKEEIELMKKLGELPEEITNAATAFEPSNLTRYVIDLASCFHSFYSACRVKDDDVKVREARLKLADSTRAVIKLVLDILGVSAPEQM